MYDLREEPRNQHVSRASYPKASPVSMVKIIHIEKYTYKKSFRFLIYNGNFRSLADDRAPNRLSALGN